MTKTNSFLLLSLVLSLGCLLGQAQAGNLYRWVDSSGTVHYADSVPPNYSQTGHAELNALGMTLKNVPAAKTTEQAQEDDWIKDLEGKRQKFKDRQQQEDRELLTTFTDVKQLDESHQSRIKMLQDSRKQMELLRDKLKLEIADLQAALTKSKDAEQKRVQGFIDTKQKSMSDYEMAIQQSLAEEKSAELAFQKQRSRFIELLDKQKAREAS
ncbi:DUF4124 domain-containing protein [uncultured Thiothrix sp.]|uniref:DUF4124 domain-containing protein n=1 Tax=uncultured Thiothrix sp. TaxID=223185 RepID=UPI00260FB771|nr:DUF4124 domain-containing protein [uncultured Thiothrix sp.]